ncbi:MAG: mannose-6-phosphate isomerase, class I [Treponema sp.]|jgi:mannose-6-phosphate isomerase|nr:mannose-6-phosphate isomerase, class I [Treponema sp.]
MGKIYKLSNQIKHYEWGSCDLIPQLLNINNKAKVPHAEMWMGTHSGAPSQINAAFPEAKQYLADVSGQLPFLIKLIAVEQQLSIQAHPNKEQAAEGFRQENMANLAMNDPARNFKDPNHKPEILCAITPFTLLAGFRKVESIQKSLEEVILILPQLKEIISNLLKALISGSLTAFFHILFDFSVLEREYICSLILEKELSRETQGISAEQWKLMQKLAAIYPNDAAILSPLYLNLMTLQPWQAIFVPTGVLHSYVSGFGIELMTSSDNVLRGGLTPKYINVPQLISIIDFNSYMPSVLSPGASAWHCYQTPCDEFTLALMRGDGKERNFPEKRNAICIVTDGELYAGGNKFVKGESFFIPPVTDGEAVSFSGNYTLFAAFEGNDILL